MGFSRYSARVAHVPTTTGECTILISLPFSRHEVTLHGQLRFRVSRSNSQGEEAILRAHFEG